MWGDHQVQQFQEAAAVVLGPAGLLGSNIAHGAAGADQPLHLQVQVLVLGLSHRDPGVAVQRHPALPLAGIPEVWLSASGVATGFASHPLSYDKGDFTAGGWKQPVSSQGRRVRPGRCQWRLRIVIPVGCSCHEFRAHSDSADVAPVQ